MFRALILALFALVLNGCASLAWPVDDATTVAKLDDTYFDELAEVERSDVCVVGDPLRSFSRVQRMRAAQAPGAPGLLASAAHAS